jgi:membrane protease YdiL (CAAX protease family)
MQTAFRLGTAGALFVFVYGTGLFGATSIARAVGWTQTRPWLVTTGLLTQVTFLVLSLALMAVLARGRLEIFGLRAAPLRCVRRAVVVTAVIMLVLLSPMVVGSLLGPPAPASGPASGPSRGPPPAAGGLVQTIVFVWLIASTCEEVFYRGLLQGWLTPLATIRIGFSRARLSVPVVLCGVAFGLGHLCLLGIVPRPLLVGILVVATLVGLVAGYYREQSGSLLPAIAAHMTGNIVGTLVPLLLAAPKVGG